VSAGIVDNDEQEAAIATVIGPPTTPVSSPERAVEPPAPLPPGGPRPTPARLPLRPFLLRLQPDVADRPSRDPRPLEDRPPVERRPPVETATGPPPSPPVLTTDPTFVLTSELAAIRRQSTWQFAKAVVRRRTELRRALSALRALPRLTIPVRDTTASRDLTHLLRKRVGPLHYRSYAVAVLEVPSEAGAYRKGRSRQALRTNAGKAAADGTSCVTLSGSAEILRRFDQIIVDGWGVRPSSRKHRKWTRNVEDVPHALYFAALTPDDRTQVFSKLFVADGHARLHTFIQNGDKSASNARFLLTEYMIESLVARGVKYLIVDTILGLPGGLRYLQQLLGYRPLNLTIAPDRSLSAGRPVP
jgi:hypothetical protein